MSEPNESVTKSGASTRPQGHSAPFRFAGAVLQPGESGEARQRKNSQAEFRKQAIVSLGIAVGFGLFFVLSGLGPLLVGELTYAYGYKISEPLQFLCSAYIFWSVYWGFKELVYLSESEKDPPEAVTPILEGAKALSHLSHAGPFLLVGLFVVPLIFGGSVLLFVRRVSRGW